MTTGLERSFFFDIDAEQEKSIELMEYFDNLITSNEECVVQSLKLVDPVYLVDLPYPDIFSLSESNSLEIQAPKEMIEAKYDVYDPLVPVRSWDFPFEIDL